MARCERSEDRSGLDGPAQKLDLYCRGGLACQPGSDSWRAAECGHAGRRSRSSLVCPRLWFRCWRSDSPPRNGVPRSRRRTSRRSRSARRSTTRPRTRSYSAPSASRTQPLRSPSSLTTRDASSRTTSALAATTAAPATRGFTRGRPAGLASCGRSTTPLAAAPPSLATFGRPAPARARGGSGTE